MKYFKETQIDTIGDFNGKEEEAVGIIDTILEKIEDLIDEKYTNINVENANDIQNMVWEYVCDYSESLDESEEDYQKTANSIFNHVQISE
jgi:ABC-type iron transport system FetAB ATPase subunit